VNGGAPEAAQNLTELDCDPFHKTISPEMALPEASNPDMAADPSNVNTSARLRSSPEYSE
jgi:hypothetical protein